MEKKTPLRFFVSGWQRRQQQGRGQGGGAREALKKPPRLFSQRRVRAGTGKAGGNARFTGAPRAAGQPPPRPLPCEKSVLFLKKHLKKCTSGVFYILAYSF
ncbi:MAG: hypothetical protein J6S98_07280 [Lentisphaeria bacterium]|nr:hypothetical protein [Lentisphaeria bacterium]